MNLRRSWPIGTALATVALVAVMVTPGAGLRAADPAEVLRPGHGACGFISEVHLPSGRVFCTHGPDPAPAGVDIHRAFYPGHTPAGLLLPEPVSQGPPTPAAAAAGPPRVRCFGDGQSGNRVETIYARPADRPDRYDQVVGSLRQFAAEMDAVFAQSAGLRGATRRVRFVTDPACNLVVDHVVLTAHGADNLEATTAELAGQGYNRTNRKYLVWVDATELCGIAGYYVDDRQSPDNFNNGSPGAPATVARIDSGCWGLASQGGSVEAHEIMHSLGAIMPSAPNSSPAGHCNDGHDRMCYADGTVLELRTVCPPDHEALFDCDNDDYFDPVPARGSYLDTHWDTARSSFLENNDGTPKISIGSTRVVVGPSGTVDAVLPVTLDTPSPNPVSVDWATADDTAASDRGDYTPASGTVRFPAGQTAQTLAVRVTGHSGAPPSDQRFVVNLSRPVSALLLNSQGFGIIGHISSRIGYWLVATDGGIFAFGDAPFYGSTGNIKLNRPINGMAPTPSGAGYWMVADDGGIFAFGDARFFGSTGALKLDKPIVGIATTPSGGGYWLAGAGGQVFNFGDAGPLGSLPGPPSAPIVGITPTVTGGGYWLVGQDGHVYRFGDAADLGSTPPPSQPVVGIAPTVSGGGYWLVGRDGHVYRLGDAAELGSTPPPSRPIVGIASSATGGGYWVVGSDGGIFAFGDAPFRGSTGNIRLNKPIVGMSPVR